MFKNQKQLRLVAVGLVVIMGVFACAGCLKGKNKPNRPQRTKVGFPMQVIDSYQRQVTLRQSPKRIISLAPNITETLYVLGKGRLLVGRTDYCDYPAAVRRVASVGSLQAPNIEKILQLKPDLVIASTHFTRTVLTQLERLGIKVVVLYGEESFDGVYDTIGQIGRIVDAHQVANRVINVMRRNVDEVVARVKGLPKPTVYYVVSFGRMGDYTAGRGTFIAKMLALAGGANVAHDTEGWQYSLESLLEQNPEIVICSQYFNTKAQLQQTAVYRDLSAIKAGRLFTIDNNLLDRQGPRLADGLTALARIIHPEAFKEASGE